MTDKQIIIYKKECYNEPHCSLNQVLEQLKAKEQECEELKRQLETKGKILTLIDEAKNEYSKENQKLKQTLTEIKEIANSDNHYFSDGTILRYEVVNKILQKISEVEE